MYICHLNPRPLRWQHFLRLALGLVWLGGVALGQGFPFVQRTFQSEEGLPSNHVRTVAVDTHGLLWVGTDAGVVRFDGMKFRPFTKEKEVALSRKSVWRLYPLANGDVWVGLIGGGVLRWDGANLTEIMPDEAEFAPKNQILLEEGGRVLLSVFTGRERGIFYAWPARCAAICVAYG